VFEDGEVAEANRRLRLLGDTCDGSTASLSAFAGAAVLKEHVVVGLGHCGGSSLKRIARAASDGDLRLSAELQVALAMDMARALRRLHGAGVVHGSVAPDMVMVTLHQPCRAMLLFMGTASEKRGKEADVHDLGLLLASLALGRLVAAGTLPTETELRAAGAAVDQDHTFPALLELIIQMTQTADVPLRPSADEVCSWLEAIAKEQGVDETSSRVLEATRGLGSVPAIYELQRPQSPLRRF
jgi:hypothetical protein